MTGALGPRAANNAGGRRALADVGNLDKVISGRSGKDTTERAFGTNLSNVQQSKDVQKKPQRSLPVRVAASGQCEPAAAVKSQSQTGSTGGGGGGRSSTIMTRAQRAAMVAAKAATEAAAQAEAAIKEQGMTATLTNIAEEAVGCMDAEMDDAEACDALDEIDAQDLRDPLAVAEYVADIYSFYRKSEASSLVPPSYMCLQSEINEKMRAILLDWLVEVHLKFKLLPETLYLTANLIDRFLSVCTVTRKNLQLVGVTAMLLASKYEEIWAPEVKDFVYISDNAYTKDQILGMEKLILNTLQFNLTVPTPYVFTHRLLKAAKADRKTTQVAWFLTELCLPEYTMLHFSPSHVAAAAVLTARRTAGINPAWTPALQRHAQLSEYELRGCVQLMVGLQERSGEGSLTAVHKKYSHTKFDAVAKLEPPILPADDGCSRS